MPHKLCERLCVYAPYSIYLVDFLYLSSRSYCVYLISNALTDLRQPLLVARASPLHPTQPALLFAVLLLRNATVLAFFFRFLFVVG